MSRKLRIFTETSSLIDGRLKNLSPLLSFHWTGLSIDDILANRSNPDSPFVLTSDPSESDFFVLPMHWTYYLWNGKAKMHEAVQFAELASEVKKEVIIWFKGDLVPIIPFDNAVMFLPGALRSRAPRWYRACPVFIDDPDPLFRHEGIAQYRNKSAKPSVGFCGYAAVDGLKTAWSIFQGTQMNLASRFGRFDFSAVPIVPATLLRANALKLLSKHPGVESNFVIRRKYTGPNSVASPQGQDTGDVFFTNIYENDYTLCVRGYGNWSFRFYQTLACGRIPVFVDTDCLLPLPSVDWKKYCVWIDLPELKYIGEKVADFHSSMSPSDFLELQISCRKLWKDHLTPKGFFNRSFPLDRPYDPVESAGI